MILVIVMCSGAFLLIQSVRAFWMRWVAIRQIRIWLAERNLQGVEISRLRVFGPHCDSVAEAALALILHFEVQAIDAAGSRLHKIFEVSFAPLSARFSSLRVLEFSSGEANITSEK